MKICQSVKWLGDSELKCFLPEKHPGSHKYSAVRSVEQDAEDIASVRAQVGADIAVLTNAESRLRRLVNELADFDPPAGRELAFLIDGLEGFSLGLVEKK